MCSHQGEMAANRSADDSISKDALELTNKVKSITSQASNGDPGLPDLN